MFFEGLLQHIDYCQLEAPASDRLVFSVVSENECFLVILVVRYWNHVLLPVVSLTYTGNIIFYY